MKKIFAILISAILIILLGLGTIGYFVEKGEKEEEKTKQEIVIKEEKEEKIDEKLTIDKEKLDVNKIEGFTEGKNLYDESVTVNGRSLPYDISSKNIQIVSIGSYSGKFLEDGSDVTKENVLAMVVKNTSEKVIDYCEINMRISNKKGLLKFKITNLKPGFATLVMESSKESQFNVEDEYIYVSAINNTVEELPLTSEKVEITTEDEKITVKNKGDEKIGTFYVYYKTISPGNCYLGGITYRAKFENIEPKKSLSVNTLHFSNTNSEILKVEEIEE